MVYLLDIYYNLKKFAIFKDLKGNKIFLEKNNEQFKYPLEKDLKYLNDVYNNKDCFILYDYNLRDKDKIKRLVAKSCIIIDMLLLFRFVSLWKETLKYYDLNISSDKIALELKDEYFISDVPQQFRYGIVFIEDLNQLDDILGYEKVSLDLVNRAIKENSNINDSFKICAYNLVRAVNQNHPNFDFRIFYENMKTLQIIKLTPEELQEFGGNIAGCYVAKENKIYYCDDNNYSTITHELAHTMGSFYRNIKGKNFVRMGYKGRFLNEALTSKLAQESIKSETYQDEIAITEYLMKCSSYTLEDYNLLGSDYLIKLLKEKYSTVDINYIIDVMDTYMDTYIHEEIKTSLKDSPYLLDELFKICLLNVQENNIDSSFLDFIQIFKNDRDKDLVDGYLEKYNNYLRSLNFTEILEKEELNLRKYRRL